MDLVIENGRAWVSSVGFQKAHAAARLHWDSLIGMWVLTLGWTWCSLNRIPVYVRG